MTALAIACRLILYCHGPHVRDVANAIDAACEHHHPGNFDRICVAALVVTVHNETRWYLSASAVQFSPWGLVTAARAGDWTPGVTPYSHAAWMAWDTLRLGRRRCGSWAGAFTWYVLGDLRGRCPRVGPEGRQRWGQSGDCCARADLAVGSTNDNARAALPHARGHDRRMEVRRWMSIARRAYSLTSPERDSHGCSLFAALNVQ